jgi:hypothetical protein
MPGREPVSRLSDGPVARSVYTSNEETANRQVVRPVGTMNGTTEGHPVRAVFDRIVPC